MSDPLSKHVDAILFDCDGVLLDSVLLKEQAFREIIAERIPEHVDATMDYFWKNGGTSRLEKFRWIWANLVGRPLDPAQLRELGATFEMRVQALVTNCPMIAGAEDFLNRHCPALPCYVISGTPQAELQAILQARGMDRYFRGVYGSPESKTEIGDRILASNPYDRKRVFFIGDATTDRDAARKLGVRFVGIDGPHLQPFLDGTEVMIHDLRGLEGALSNDR